MTNIGTFADDECNEYLALLKTLSDYLSKGMEPPLNLLEKVMPDDKIENFKSMIQREEKHGMHDLNRVISDIEKKIFGLRKPKKRKVKIKNKPYSIHTSSNKNSSFVEAIYGIKSEESLWVKYMKWFTGGRNFGDYARGTLIINNNSSPGRPKGVPNIDFTDMILMSDKKKDEYKHEYHNLWLEHESKYGEEDIEIAEQIARKIEQTRDPFEVIKLDGVLHFTYKDTFLTSFSQRQVAMMERTIGKKNEPVNTDTVTTMWKWVDDAKKFSDTIRNNYKTISIEEIVNSSDAFYYPHRGKLNILARNHDLIVCAHTNKNSKNKRKELCTLIDNILDKNNQHFYQWKNKEDAKEYMSRVRDKFSISKEKPSSNIYDELVVIKRGDSEHIIIRSDNIVYEEKTPRLGLNGIKKCVKKLNNWKKRKEGLTEEEVTHKVEELKLTQQDLPIGNTLVDETTILDNLEYYKAFTVQKKKGLISDNYFKNPLGKRVYAASINMDVLINNRKLELKIMTPSSFYQAFIGNPEWRTYHNRTSEKEHKGQVYNLIQIFQRDDKQSREEIMDNIIIKKAESDLETYSTILFECVETEEELYQCIKESLEIFNTVKKIKGKETNGVLDLLLRLPADYISKRGLSSIEDAKILGNIKERVTSDFLGNHYLELIHTERLKGIMKFTNKYLKTKFNEGVINKVMAYGLRSLIINYERIHSVNGINYENVLGIESMENMNNNFVKLNLKDDISECIVTEDLKAFNDGTALFVRTNQDVKQQGINKKGYFVVDAVPIGLSTRSSLKKKVDLYEFGSQFKNELNNNGFTKEEIKYVSQRSNALIRSLKVNHNFYKNIPTI